MLFRSGEAHDAYGEGRYRQGFRAGEEDRGYKPAIMICKGNGYTEASYAKAIGNGANGISVATEFIEGAKGVEISDAFKEFSKEAMNGHSAEAFTVVAIYGFFERSTIILSLAQDILLNCLREAIPVRSIRYNVGNFFQLSISVFHRDPQRCPANHGAVHSHGVPTCGWRSRSRRISNPRR